MRKCRNWQTSKTKDLVIIAIVWVQVPSSALLNLVQKPYKSRALKKSNSSKKELGFFSALKIKRFVVFIKHLCD